MADVMMHRQALIPVCRGTSQPSQWADSSILPHQPYPSAGQSSPFSNGDLWPRGPFSYDQAASDTFELLNPDAFDDVLFSNHTEPSQTEKEFRDPALAVRLQLDQGEQYIIERYLRGETWHTIKEGFEGRFGASGSSEKSALAMRFTRLKQKHSEIRSLAEEAFPDRHRRRKGRRNRWETEAQGESMRTDQWPGAGQGRCSEQRQRERRGEPRNVSQKTFKEHKTRRITQREAALAADRLLVFLGLPEVQGRLIAQSDCVSVVRVRSRLHE